jgi:hypothetical protein
LTSLLTSYAAEVGLGVIEVLGVERRRRWPDAVKMEKNDSQKSAKVVLGLATRVVIAWLT